MSDNNIEIESLLDQELDALADLPEFKPFPAGTYACTLVMETKMVNDKPCIEASFTLREVLELADPNLDESQHPKQGDTSGVLYQLTNKIGQGKFKNNTAAIAAHFGLVKPKIREIVETCKGGIDVAVTMKTRMNKEKTQEYQDVVGIEVV